MKKFLKIVVINFAILTLLLCVIEFILFRAAVNNFENFNSTYNLDSNKLKYNLKLDSVEDTMNKDFRFVIRKPIGLEYHKKPIFLFGCSYTYGQALEDNQTFAYKLSHLTKRPVYNRALPGKGIQHMYWQLNSPLFFNEVNVVPEYIIYGFSYNLQAVRLYQYIFQLFDNELYLRYYPDKLDKNGDLIEKKPILPKYLNGLYIVRYLEEIHVKKINTDPYIPMFEDFVFLTFHKAKEKALKHYPNVKFVIYCFDACEKDIEDHLQLLKRLENDGFIIVKQTELSNVNLQDIKYKISENDPHPNENYWNDITPKLAKKLNL